jgi:hypothetical protein
MNIPNIAYLKKQNNARLKILLFPQYDHAVTLSDKLLSNPKNITFAITA